MGDQEDSNKLVCPDCQFTTRKERKFVKHVRKSHDKDALKCPFCVTNVYYSSDTSGLCSHKRHRHRQIRLKCFLCEFSSKSLRRWTDHLIHGHGKQSQRVADLGNKQRNDCLSPTLTSTSQMCSTPIDRHNTKTECKPQGKRDVENCSDLEVNKIISMKNQFEICENENEYVMKKLKYSKKRKRLCSEDDSKKHVIDLTNDRNNEFSKKQSTDRIKKQTKQLFVDNDTAINVSSDESSYNKELNKSYISKVDKGGDNPSKRKKTKSIDVLPSLSDAVMICLSSDEGHGETVKEESEESSKLDSYLVMVRQKKSSGEGNQFTCPYCNQCFSSYKIRNKHFRTHHSDFVTPESKYACKLCSYSCTYIADLSRHIISHTGEKSFVCEICHQRFKLKCALVRHVKEHSYEKPFKCHLCSYRSKQKANLERHMRYHTNTRPYKCSMCDYAGYTPGHLTLHIRTHTGEKPFKCHHCHRDFSQKGNLNKHLKIRACY